MEINIHQEKKLVEIWLTNCEKQDPQMQEYLNALYRKYAQKHYFTAVFQSGSEDLVEATSALLCHNRTRAAELAVQQKRENSMV